MRDLIRTMVRRRQTRRCPSGTILRKAYVRVSRRTQKRSRVPAACIPDVGAPGKGLPGGQPGIGRLRQGDLAQFGYVNAKALTEGKRHIALAKAVAAYGALSVWRKLNAVYIYTRRTAPASSAVFGADRDWIMSHYGIAAA